MTRRFFRRRGAAPKVGPKTRMTSAPNLAASNAKAIPIWPLEPFDKNLTGSQCSRVGPAVMRTFLSRRLLKYLLTRTNFENLRRDRFWVRHAPEPDIPGAAERPFLRADELIPVTPEC